MKSIYKAAWAAAAFSALLLCSGSAFAQWARWYPNPMAAEDSNGASIAVNSDGTLFVGALAHDSGFWDAMLIKYTTVGTRVFTRVYHTGVPDTDSVSALVKLDGSGGLYLATESASGTGTTQLALLKYSLTGTFTWIRRYADPAGQNLTVAALVPDPAGSMVLAASAKSSSTAGDIVVVKYSTDGVKQWARATTDAGSTVDTAVGACVDASGSVYAVGYVKLSDGSDRILTRAYTSSGASVWAKYYVDSTSALVSGIAESGGDVWVVGTAYDGTTNRRALVLQYSAATGALVSHNSFGTNTGDCFGVSIAAAAGGGLFVAADYYEPASAYNIAALALDASGNLLWEHQFDHGGEDLAACIAVDANSNVTIGGYSYDSSSQPHLAALKYSPAGTRLWAHVYSAPLSLATAVDLDSSGGAYLTGSVHDTGTGLYDVLTVHYLP